MAQSFKYKQTVVGRQTVDGPVDEKMWIPLNDEKEPLVPGLVLLNLEPHWTEEVREEYGSSNSWAIVHAYSGYCIAVGFEKRDSAAEACQWLEGLADWEEPPLKLLEDKYLKGRVNETLWDFGQGTAS